MEPTRRHQTRPPVVGLRSLVHPSVVFIALLLGTLWADELLPYQGVPLLEALRGFLVLALPAGAWLSGVYLLERMLQVFVWEGLAPRALGAPIPRVVRDIVAGMLFLVAFLCVVALVLGRDITGLLTVLSASGVVIGLALRNLIVDLFVGVALNLDRSFVIGDWVQLEKMDVTGRVEEITWRTTKLLTADNNLLVIPNNRLGDLMVTNLSQPTPVSEHIIDVTLAHAVPVERATRVLQSALLSVAAEAGIQEGGSVRVAEIRDLGVKYCVCFSVDRLKASATRARHLITTSILQQLAVTGLAPVAPRLEVHRADKMSHATAHSQLAEHMALLQQTQLFSCLDEADTRMLAQGMQEERYEAGQTLCTQGEPGQSMFVIKEGVCDVLIDFKQDGKPARVAQVCGGGFFGEMSLLTGEPRTATVRAVTSVVACKLGKEQVERVIAAQPELVERVATVVATRRLRNHEVWEQADALSRDRERNHVVKDLMGRNCTFFGRVLSREERSGVDVPP